MSYELKHTIEGKAKLVAFNPRDNSSLLSVITNEHRDMIYLWKEVDKDKQWVRVKEFKPNTNINNLSFSPDGTKFVNTADDDSFELWTIDTGLKESYNAAEDTLYSELSKKIGEDWLENHQPVIFNTFFTTNTNLLSAETSDEISDSPPPMTVFRQFSTTAGSSQVSSLTNLFNNTQVSHEELTLVNKSIKKLETHEFFASPSREFFATTHIDRTTRKGYVWIRNNVGDALWKFIDNDTNNISYVAFNPTYNYQYATGGPNYVKLWGLTDEKIIINTGILKHTYDGGKYSYDKNVKSIAWSPDGKTIAFINESPVVIIYRVNKTCSWEIYKTIETSAKPNQVCFDSTGIQLAVVTDAYIQIWYDMEKIKKYFGNTEGELPFDVVGNIVEYTGEIPCGAIQVQRAVEYGTGELKQIRDILASIPIDIALAALTNTSKGGRTRRNRKKRKSVKIRTINNLNKRKGVTPSRISHKL